ncbi:MAG TPA: glycosyl transferase family 1 [Cyanobacteria bacterium UBA11149]|nr:glycosyl transferase family 1 [Cyanobacteria bacterium UBA11367]HBE56525.1 glycosyl transferase family 1 [Cyanobacteria bacterium UBA11366]HBK62381.1 glycosyl transferase family 1 [Cyanobacteria bacterium UBA11166]HBR75686.1 glycosyl transferase family 1 [Cyanobacteria bacterium UBA11159]HBS68616.1 glycosyl transferase family 1 [Cyanobacteria bacterium UBA11153]HBW91337.1 glycosyl transferase family 1 [Cyanobacteria bacterium UBA11149]HCA97765.1 glycosyl transferase family 1 [Cyanobacteria
MKFALVHEWLTPKATGGSELVVREILQHIDADIYALIDFESTNPHSYLFGRKIGTTFLQNMPLASNGVQKYLPLLPLAIEQLDLRAYDVILSSSHAVAKGVLSSPQQLHICYCHTPMRYAWDLTFDYLRHSVMGSGLQGWATRYLLHQLRQWDVVSANRVDYFIANSHHTAKRIWRCYRREAEVIYPPVNIERFPFSEQKEDFYLTVSRLVTYKQVSVIVEAFNQLGYPLVVIGDGPQLETIRQMAKPNVQLLGFQPDKVVEEYMAKAKAFVYAACEDFGIALVEAMAGGTPVIAYGAGGALEIVLDIRKHPKDGTGLFFMEQSPAALIEAVKIFAASASTFNPQRTRLAASAFSPNIFRDRYLGFLDRCDRSYRDHIP